MASRIGRCWRSVATSIPSRNSGPRGSGPAGHPRSGRRRAAARGRRRVGLRPPASAVVPLRRHPVVHLGEEPGLDGVEPGGQPCGDVGVATVLAHGVDGPPDLAPRRRRDAEGAQARRRGTGRRRSRRQPRAAGSRSPRQPRRSRGCSSEVVAPRSPAANTSSTLAIDHPPLDGRDDELRGEHPESGDDHLARHLAHAPGTAAVVAGDLGQARGGPVVAPGPKPRPSNSACTSGAKYTLLASGSRALRSRRAARAHRPGGHPKVDLTAPSVSSLATGRPVGGIQSSTAGCSVASCGDDG